MTKPLRLAGDHLLPEAGLDLVEQGLVAPQPAGLEQGGPDRVVGGRERDQLVDRAGRGPELQAEVPEQVEDGLDGLPRPAPGLVRSDEGDVDVGMKRHLAPAVAADRQEQQPVGAARRRKFADLMVEGEANDLVGQEGVGGGGLAARIGPGVETARDLGPPGGQRLLEHRRRRVRGRSERVGEGAPVDDRPFVGDGGEAGRHQPSPAESRFSR